ncbi:NUDIX hydrolase, partial [Micromonosporaceae bacterium B7E4]
HISTTGPRLRCGTPACPQEGKITERKAQTAPLDRPRSFMDDTAYERAGEPTKIRFVRQVKVSEATDSASGDGVALTVAIAVVATESEVLIVCRRDENPAGITWQFPAGIVKPGALARTIAVRETLAETGIHCVVRRELGSRIHPLSGVNCAYFLCDYLAGTVENRDASENVDTIWVQRQDLPRFIPSDRIYPPILRAFEGGQGESAGEK